MVKYQFEWDPEKAGSNIRKHGVSFERTAAIFLDPRAVSIFDKEHSSGEDRWITIGEDINGVVLVAVHTFTDLNDGHCLIRLISARKAGAGEKGQYLERR